MPASPLLSAFYFGTVEHYALLARCGHALIDAGEHYERQSYRSRTRIIGPNGVQELVVPIVRRSGMKMAMHDVGLSYAEPWHTRHLQAVRTAYGQTPWFIHYMPDLEALLTRRYERLIDLDLATMRTVLKWLRSPVTIEIREQFVEDVAGSEDHRKDLHPKKALPPGIPAVKPYPQVFEDRHGFSGRLSILDLLMNTGPGASELLLR